MLSLNQADGQHGHPGPVVGAFAIGVPSLFLASNEAAAAAARGFTGGSTSARVPSPR